MTDERQLVLADLEAAARSIEHMLVVLRSVLERPGSEGNDRLALAVTRELRGLQEATVRAARRLPANAAADERRWRRQSARVDAVVADITRSLGIAALPPMPRAGAKETT